MMKKLFIVFLFWNFQLQADVLFTETFDNEGIWPVGWTYEQYIDPDTDQPYVLGHNWKVSSGYQESTESAAIFEWYPRIPLPTNEMLNTANDAINNPQSSLETSYQLSLQSPDINVGGNNGVLVKFKISLDYWDSESSHINGLIVEADGGNGWSEMLRYEVGGANAGSDFSTDARIESFTVPIESGLLKLKWKAYGTDSYFINAWIIDDVEVLTLPKLSFVGIESNNETSSQSAINDDIITLTFTSQQDLYELPYVQINGYESIVTALGANSFFSNHTVSNLDIDGPITFTIDFIALDGQIEGATVKNTTNNTYVIIDKTSPPRFDVGNLVSTEGGNIFPGKWNSTNTSMNIDVTVPEDSSVVDFNYFEGNSISFNGNSDRVVIGGSSIYEFSDQFTVEAWIKPNSTSSDNYRGIISFGKDDESSPYGYGFAYYATGWRFFIKTQSFSVSQWTSLPYVSVPSGQWTHLAATYDGFKLILYKNGSFVQQIVTADQETEPSEPVLWPENPGDLYIGSFNKDDNDYFFNGNIDEIRLWNTVRSSAQIKGNKSITLVGNESGLVGYWKADESLGDTLSDETSNQIDGTLDGASFATLNSPINFSTPIYDNTVIIGSNYKLRAKIGTNEFEIFDDFQEITLADFNANQKNISGEATNFSNVTGYQHGENAMISAVLYDQSGNQSLGDTSAMILEIDLIANEPTYVNIVSNNSNSVYAKTGDIVTLTMSYDEDIIFTESFIESNAAINTGLGGEQFKAEYILSGNEPEGVLDFIINATDYMGNSGSYGSTTDGSQITYDKTLPQLTNVNIASNNADIAWAKVGDTIIISFVSNEEILVPTVSILNQVSIVSNLQNNNYEAVYAPNSSDIEGEVNFEIQFSDLAGNEGTPITASTNNTKVIFDKTPPADFTVGLLTPTGGNQVDGIWNSTNTGMDIIIPIANDTTLKNGTVQLYGKVGSNNFEVLASFSTVLSNEINANKIISVSGSLIEGLTGFTDGQRIYVKAMMSDRPGNITEGSQSITQILIDEMPASITPISIFSSNNDTALAKVGDTIKVSFSTSENLIDIAATISNQSAIITDLGSNQFIAQYIMDQDDSEGVIEFEISFIDAQGNPLNDNNSTTDASQIVFDKTKPTLDPVTIISDNLCSSGLIAKADNIVTINFTSSETLLSTFAVVMSDTVSIIDEGFDSYKIDYQLTSEDIEGDVSFLIQVVDLSGNISEDIINTTDGSSVSLDLTKPLLDYVHIESDNSYSSVAVLGNIVTLIFEPVEPLSSTSVLMAGTPVSVTENGGSYLATYTIQSSDTISGGFIQFAIDFIDCAGNIGLTDSTTSDESFVSIDIGPPEMVSVAMYSSNQDSSWAKVGDSVFVYFVVNEPLKIIGYPDNASAPFSSLKIGENFVEVSNIPNTTTYTGFYIMSEFDIEGTVTPEIMFYDIGSQAGNSGSPIQTTTDESIVIFDKTKPVITQASFLSNNTYGDSLAKVDDVGTISIVLNEKLRSISAIVDGNSILMNGDNQNFSYNYSFSDSNNNGWIILSMVALDSASNQADTIIDRIYFDKAAPKLSAVYEGSINEDKVYSKHGDSLQLSWHKVELESGIKTAYIGLGSDSGLVDIVDWTMVSGDDESSLTSLNLENNSKYYGSIFLEDNTGNLSDPLWGNGIIIDLEKPSVGNVWEGSLDEDIDYTADSTTIFVRWDGFTDNQSIDYYEARVGVVDKNNDTTNITNWQRSDFLNNLQFQGLGLERDKIYFAYLRAIDSASNESDIIISDGIEFDNSPPDLKSVYPLFDSLQVLSIINNAQIKISFNKPVVKFGFSVNATQGNDLNYSTTIQDSGIIISFLDTLPSYETIIVNIDTAIAFNLLNYTDTIIFKSKLWGDLNGDYKISVEDVLIFNQGWLQPETDLGPISGSPPYLFPTPDNKFELNDLVVFGNMWIWYYHEYQADSVFVLNYNQNDDLKIQWEGNNLNLSVPDSSYGAEITFFDSNFDNNDITITNVKNSAFSFTAIDSHHNSASFIIADKNGLGPKVSFHLKDRSLKTFSSSMKYKFIDSVSTEISNGVEKINVEVLPKNFSLFQNYPNPFNNETIIKYEIPVTSDIVIKIYDIVGREIFSKSFFDQNPGVKHFNWEGHDSKSELVSSGVYFFQISDGENVRRMKMILLK